MPIPANYYTVIFREGKNKDWQRGIGSWHQQECEGELQAWLDSGWSRGNLSIITTRGDDHRAVDAKLQTRNVIESE